MTAPSDTIEHMTVTADDLDEAVVFVVEQLQRLAVERGARGFRLPSLTQESVELIDGEWARVFEFSAEFIPGVPDGRS